jgi:hypothetical protein
MQNIVVPPELTTVLEDLTDVLKQSGCGIYPGRICARQNDDLVLNFVTEDSSKIMVWLHFSPDSVEKCFRRGEAFAASYSWPGSDPPPMDLISAVFDAIFTMENDFILACKNIASWPPLLSDEQSLIASQQKEAEIRLDILNQMEELKSDIEGLSLSRMTLTYNENNGMTFETEINNDTVKIDIHSLGAMHNPFVHGRYLAFTIGTDCLPTESYPAFSSCLSILLKHEAALSDLLRDISQERFSSDLLRSNASLFQTGKLLALDELISDEEKLFPPGDIGLIYLSSPCFANCVFCSERSTEYYTFSVVEDVLESIEKRTFDLRKAIICGYEPLSHPGVPQMISVCRATGISEVELMTTGIPLGDRFLTKALVEAGLSSVVVPLYACDSTLNDLIMRKRGAFANTCNGLDQMRHAGVQIFLHSLALPQNLAELDPLYTMSLERWDSRLVASPPRRKIAEQECLFSYSEAERQVRQTPLLAVPLCLHPRMADHPDVRLDRPLQVSLRGVADTMRYYFSQGLVQEEPCAKCRFKIACKGILAHHLEKLPKPVLRPFALD